jgi:hypothetical protein
VSESRQQRRARERREAKEATRPGPRIPEAPETAAVKQDRVVEVELNRMVFDDDPAEVYVSWHAEWGLRDSSVGTEDSSEDLAALVESVLSDQRSMTDRYIVRLEWTLGGDPPEGETVDEAVVELGVRLPEVVA